ncbi:hypothetical protein ACR3K2_09420 [Cryptosporidium serpentis]
MPILPAVDFVSLHYTPFAERVQSSSYNRNQLIINQVYHSVWIFCSNDVDSLCTLNILMNQFLRRDNISCLINSVTHYNEISSILQEYEKYSTQRECVEVCILINLGAMVNIVTFMKSWFSANVEFWIFDYHRPIIDDLFLNSNGLENCIVILSQQEINFLNRQQNKKRKDEKKGNNEQKKTLDIINNSLPSLSQTIDDLDILMGAKDLSDSKLDDKDTYKEVNTSNSDSDSYFGEYTGDPSSFVILQALNNAFSSDRINGNVLWYASISISWHYFNHYIEALDYKVYIDTINNILLKYIKSNTSKYDRKQWPKYIRKDLYIPLYRHWNLLEAINCCDILFTNMNLWKIENYREYIMMGRVSAGLSLDEFTENFYLLDKFQSKKLVTELPKGFGSLIDNGQSSISLTISTFIKHLPAVVLDVGMHPHISSYDMALILHATLTGCSQTSTLSRYISESNSTINKQDTPISVGISIENITKMELMYRDNFRVALQLLQLCTSDGNSYIGSSQTRNIWRIFKQYIDETKQLLLLTIKYVRILLTSSTNDCVLIRHNYFTLVEYSDIEISHAYNLRFIGNILVSVLSKGHDLQDRFVIVNKDNLSQIATVVGITPGCDIHNPNIFGSLFSKAMDNLNENKVDGYNKSFPNYFIQDDFDFCIIRLHLNILDKFISVLFVLAENYSQNLNSIYSDDEELVQQSQDTDEVLIDDTLDHGNNNQAVISQSGSLDEEFTA